MKIGLLIAVDRELEAFLQSGEERTEGRERRCLIEGRAKTAGQETPQ